MPYNVYQYNAQRYNLNGTFHVTTLPDSLGSTDTDINDVIKQLNDAMTASETLSFDASHLFFDFCFVGSVIKVDISNKALDDTLTLLDWLSISRKPANNQWHD